MLSRPETSNEHSSANALLIHCENGRIIVRNLKVYEQILDKKYKEYNTYSAYLLFPVLNIKRRKIHSFPVPRATACPLKVGAKIYTNIHCNRS